MRLVEKRCAQIVYQLEDRALKTQGANASRSELLVLILSLSLAFHRLLLDLCQVTVNPCDDLHQGCEKEVHHDKGCSSPLVGR